MVNTQKDSLISFTVAEKTPKIRFLASLSDGRTVIQDNRPKARHAWVRLSEWLKINKNISITGLRLQAPRNINISMPPNQKGYFFGYKKHAVWNGPQFEYIGIGYHDSSVVNIVWHRKPRFDHTITEDRKPHEAGFFLIENK